MQLKIEEFNYYDSKNTFTNLDEIGETNYLIDPIEKYKERFDVFGIGDIRRDYFEYLSLIIKNYNLNYKNYFLRKFQEFEETYAKDQDFNKITDFELMSFFSSVKNEYEGRMNKTYLERSLIIEVWSQFEYAVSIIFDEFFSEEEIQEMQIKWNTNSLKSTIKSELGKIEEVNDITKKIIEGITKKLDSHIPTIKKIHKIKNAFNISYDSLDEDFKFIEIANTLRNGIHFNFIYKGRNKDSFIFSDTTYHFENNQPIVREVKSMFYLLPFIGRFVFATFRFLSQIKHEDRIENIINPYFST